ncbi:RNA 3'-terminal phosphate cyclase/enolpyruvate transferase [Paraphysoderma sedebokerense]|nr:RNA 3'-terminal phosphate cyclase/enolpyruvate transferase [Paraphysoderma sedebokerense]
MVSTNLLRFEGHTFFRQRLILSCLSGKPIRIDKIRSEDDEPGLKDYEISFLRLLERITNGSNVSISHTGTSILFQPGSLVGGVLSHTCPTSRSTTYFLEPIIVLAPFTKKPVVLTLEGITTDHIDIGIDVLRTVMLPFLKSFGVEDGVELKITKRGARPLGGGEVKFVCTPVKSLKPVNITEEGRIKRIRGIASSTRVSPQISNRLVDASRSFLTRYIPDVYVYTDVYQGATSGKSPGFCLSLVAESTSQMLYTAEVAAVPNTQPDPESLGEQCAKLLLERIEKGGCVDPVNMWVALVWGVACSEDVSKFRFPWDGENGLPDHIIQHLRDLQSFFNVTFKIKPDTNTKTILLTCVGVGFSNLNKKVT